MCIPTGTNCVHLVAHLCCFVSRDTSYCLFLTIIWLMLLKRLTLLKDIYLVEFLNIDYLYNEQMVSQIYPTEIKLEKQILLTMKPTLWT